LAARQEKAPGAFRTISEVADEIDAPQHVLRFWESKFSQLKPVKRGGRRRYYRPEDVDLLRAIRKLLYEDKFTIKGAQKLLREQGVRKVVAAYMEGEGAAVVPVVGGQPVAANGLGKPAAKGLDQGRLRGILKDLKLARDLLQDQDD
jgi:DNA-binding transcriptional MerR regulator